MEHYLDKGEVTQSAKDVFWGWSLEKWLDDALLTRGAGGGGSPSTSLLSPDGTTWTLGITNEGAITSTAGGTGGSQSLTLNSTDGSTWTITINNSGVLSQSKP